MGLGKEIMSYQTDKRVMFFKQQLRYILIGLAFVAFAVAVFALDTEFTNNIASDMSYLPFLMIAGGIYCVFHAFLWIKAMELTVHENGFSFKIGRRESTAKYDDVLEMGYGEVTYQGKSTENILLYVVFNNNEKNLYLPYITREKEGYWSEISECLGNTYVKHTGKDLTTGAQIPL